MVPFLALLLPVHLLPTVQPGEETRGRAAPECGTESGRAGASGPVTQIHLRSAGQVKILSVRVVSFPPFAFKGAP